MPLPSYFFDEIALFCSLEAQKAEKICTDKQKVVLLQRKTIVKLTINR